MAPKTCETCEFHEEQSGKVDTMWGAGKFSAWVLPLILVALAVLGFTNFLNLSACKERAQVSINEIRSDYVQRDQDIVDRYLADITRLEKNDNDIERVLSNVSQNLRRLMEAQGVRYIEPAIIHQGKQ